MTDTLFPNIQRDALISDCGRYRYWLSRTWDPAGKVLAWLMLNPSKADASTDDATIRRCVGFSRQWGFGGIAVVNLFAYRATDPSELVKPGVSPIAEPGETHPFYPNLNDGWIINKTDGRRVIAAWGCGGSLLGRDRQVMKLLASRPVECLGYTADGHPKHPVRLPGDLQPVAFKLPGGGA